MLAREGNLGVQITVDPLVKASFSLTILPSSVQYGGTATLKMSMTLNDDTLDQVPSSFILSSNYAPLNGLSVTRDGLLAGIPFNNTQLGSFSVSASGTGSGGTYATNTASWTITAPPLSASITVDKTRAKVGVPFTFSIAISQGFVVSGTNATWNFGDGTTGSSLVSSPTTVNSISKAYSAAGTYTITVTVQSAEGVSKTLSGEVTVGDGEPSGIQSFFSKPLNLALTGIGLIALFGRKRHARK